MGSHIAPPPAASTSLPAAVFITVRWGSSVLLSRRFSPPRNAPLAGVGRLELSGDKLELVAGRQRLQIQRGARVKMMVDDVSIVADATEDSAAVWSVPPLLVERRYFKADLGSLAFHAAIAGVFVALHSPMDAQASEDVGGLKVMFESQELERGGDEGGFKAGEGVSAGDATTTLPTRFGGPSGAGTPAKGASAQASRRTSSAASLPAPRTHQAEVDPLAEAAAFGMNHLLSEITRGAPTYTAWGAQNVNGSAGSPWSDLGDGDGGLGEGYGGLGASGVGWGSGGPGLGVDLGGIDAFAQANGALDRAGAPGAGRALGSHKVKPPVACGYAADDPTPLEQRCTVNVSGRLPPEAIQRTVRQNHGRLRVCFERGVSATGMQLGDRVTVQFVIARDGSVSSVQALSDAGNSTLASCVASAFAGISFPQPEGGTVSVRYPVLFTP